MMLAQLLIILLTAGLLAAMLRHVGQPAVIGEMAAGFVLGPAVFGWISPDWQARLFSPADLGEIRGLGTLGLALFMFLMGAELRIDERGAGRHLHAAARLAALSVLLPFSLGIAIAPWLHPTLAPAGVSFWPFALFVGTALCVTALPVMARILKERDLAGSEPGRLALSAAALGDVSAWLMLAVVVAARNPGAGWEQLGLTTALLVSLCAVVFGIVRPALARYFARRGAREGLHASDIPMLLVGALACAFATDHLQVHAAFGAFLFGLCVPRDDRIVAALRARVEPLVLLVLMPCFFALAGLDTTGQAFAGTGAALFGLILLTAIAGKLAAGVAGARLAGLAWRPAVMVGALMNTRGVVELIFLKVGLDAGLIGAELFTALFVTALATTLMTCPILGRLVRVPDEARTLAAGAKP
jgi:Kef-type K+ transport system membrane component KefB